MKQFIHKHIRFLTLASILVIIYITCSLYLSRYALTTTTYIYESDKITSPIELIALTDIHGNFFGKRNEKLLYQLKKQSPDCILLVGDTLNSYSKDEQFLTQLIEELKMIAPVYFTPGNHENSFLARQQAFSSALKDLVEAAGGIYLNQNYIDLVIDNEPVRIGGLYDYTFNQANVPSAQYLQKDSYQFLVDFCDTDRFKLLLSHRPESYITDDPDAHWPIDLIVSGHEHGGQIRLPFIGGFYSTHLGLFSEFMDGYHIINDIPVIISRGLGTYYSYRTPPRFQNLPEIIKIQLE